MLCFFFRTGTRKEERGKGACGRDTAAEKGSNPERIRKSRLGESESVFLSYYKEGKNKEDRKIALLSESREAMLRRRDRGRPDSFSTLIHRGGKKKKKEKDRR